MNLENAVHTALLLLPEQFNEFQFYSTLTSLSYTGQYWGGLEGGGRGLITLDIPLTPVEISPRGLDGLASVHTAIFSTPDKQSDLFFDLIASRC